MNETRIELSKEGISFPYRRYLSDSASGFILILLLFLGSDKFGFIGKLLSTDTLTEVRAFVFLLLFLLSTPVGVIINVISWVFLEPPQKVIEVFLVKNKKLFVLFKNEYNLHECMSKLGVNRKEWFVRVRYLETELTSRHSIYADKIESLRGIAILIRNLSLLSAISGTCLIVWAFPVHQVVLLFALSIFLLCLSAVVSFYFHVQIIFWAAFHAATNQPI